MSQKTEAEGIYPSDSLAVETSATKADERPQPIKHMSQPTYQSPLRHHARLGSTPRRHVKETLNARSEYSNSGDDGTAEHRVNQYLIKEEIGRGSFGAVHAAEDQYGNEYAVKEFSKSRLRKRAQSHLLRGSKKQPRPGPLAAGKGPNAPLHRRQPGAEAESSLDLIREEIAVMKKLNHPNVVNLIEVLDDPEEDSLYMVMEMCKKGVVMKVGLDQTADPYDKEKSRHWFRDMILGLEYLHAQGILHRDIKPDNCLIMADDTLKLVDFGVSEMFEKDNPEMKTAKSAGSPAFMPPELCVAKHGEVSGRACDVWSAGVTLYCLCYGHIPFEKTGVLELYESIKTEDVNLGDESDEHFRDLMTKLLEKDPEKRIKIEELRVHPWVTKGGTDPLLPVEENVKNIIDPPTEEEMNHAITGNMGHLMVVMKAVRRFKALLVQRRPELMESIFGNSRVVQPPLPINLMGRSKSTDLDDKRKIEYALTTEGVHRDIPISDSLEKRPESIDLTAMHAGDSTDGATADVKADGAGKEADRLRDTSPLPRRNSGTLHELRRKRGQAHDPLEDTLYLGIGTGTEEPAELGSVATVCESPSATDFDVYEKAYQEEIDRLFAKQKAEEDADVSKQPCAYLNRRVEHIKELRENERLIGLRTRVPIAANLAFRRLVEQAKAGIESVTTPTPSPRVAEDGSTTPSRPGIEKMLSSARENIEAAREYARRQTSYMTGAATPSKENSKPKEDPESKDEPTISEEEPLKDPSKVRGGFSKLVGKAKQNLDVARFKMASSDAK